MWRFLAGVVSALLLMTAGAFLWKSLASPDNRIGRAPEPNTAPLGFLDVAAPVEASEKTREEKRFARYDRDRNGGVSRDEYLHSRRKAFAKLDTNKDGRISFDEYAIKTGAKFAGADRDRSGVLTPAEFLTTRIVRKPGRRSECPAPSRPPARTDLGDESA